MESRKHTLSRRAEALILVGLIACLGAVGLQAATQLTTFDPAAATVGNARLLAVAITQYTQDNDELLPPTRTVAAFDAALLSYVPDPAVFDSRVTGKPFIPNPAIGGQSLASFGDPYTVEVFRDVLPPSTIPTTIDFLDGHVERGGVVQENTAYSSYLNAKALSLGVIQYTQDADEKLPPTNTQAAFQNALLPYVHDPADFIDPNNGKPFVPNPAVSEVSITTINDPYNTILLESAMPYKNGVPTIGYVDGHVTPAPPSVTGGSDAANLKKIGSATIQYTQDYDETLPPTINYTDFENALEPYLGTDAFFVSPGTGLPYILNPAISGVSIASIDTPSDTEEARDAQRNSDGTLNHLEIDGHINQDQYFVPKSVLVDQDDQTHLFWPKYSQQASVWTFLPTGITKSVDTLKTSNYSLTFGVGTDGQTRILWRNSYNSGPLGYPITGAITLDTLDVGGSLAASTRFGPYDGWTPKLLTTGADSSSRLLWQHYDGRLALWTLSPEGDYEGNLYLSKFTGLSPVGLALGNDGLTRLLGKTTTGTSRLALLTGTGRVLRAVTVPVQSGDTVTALGLGTDDASRVLASDGKDRAAVITVAANGSTVSTVSFALTGGGTAAQIAVGKAGDLRVLWEAADGSGQLQTLTAAGNQTSVTPLTPYL